MTARSFSSRRQTRRDFIKTQTMGLAAAAMCTTFNPLQSSVSYADSPNDRFTIGFIGCGGMGTGDARDLAHFGDIVAIADVNTQRTDYFKSVKEIVSKPDEVLATQDYRRVLDRDDIDVIGISTPDHWHVKMAIEALQAGKHVFCQKPLTLTIEENKLIRKAVEKYGKVFQVGTQQRADRAHFMLATLMVRKGLLGRIRRVVVTLNTGPSGGPFSSEPIPENLDWDMFLGQAPYVDYIPQRASGSFRYWYDYSGGQLTDWGAHHVDCALWALDQLGPGKGPVIIDGSDVEHASPLDKNGMPLTDNFFNTAVHFNIKMMLANGVELIVEDKPDYNGILFEGTEGRIFVDRGRVTGKPIEENRQQVLTEEDYVALNKGKPVVWHKENFIQCIREGGTPSSDVDSHTYAMNACHLCGIAARLGRTIKWDPKEETIVGDDVAASFMAREPRKGFEFPEI
ncbi:MAG: Gfo/Idh/MocA family protein [Thermoguttaceae bacterium]